MVWAAIAMSSYVVAIIGTTFIVAVMIVVMAASFHSEHEFYYDADQESTDWDY